MKRLALFSIFLLTLCFPGQIVAGNDASMWEGSSTGTGYTGDIVWEMTPDASDAEHYEVAGTIKVKFNHRDHGKGRVKIRVKGDVRNGTLVASGIGRGTIMARSFQLRVSLQGALNGDSGNGTVVSNDGFKLIEGTWEISRQ